MGAVLRGPRRSGAVCAEPVRRGVHSKLRPYGGMANLAGAGSICGGGAVLPAASYVRTNELAFSAAFRGSPLLQCSLRTCRWRLMSQLRFRRVERSEERRVG